MNIPCGKNYPKILYEPVQLEKWGIFFAAKLPILILGEAFVPLNV